EALGSGKGHVGRECGFTHARTSRKDDKIRPLKATDARVHAAESGGYAGESPAPVQRRLGAPDRGHGRLAEALRLAFGAAFFGDLVQVRFRTLDLGERGDLLARIQRAFNQVAADANEGAEQRQIVDLSSEIAGADDRRARSGELGEIGRTTH